MVLSLLHSWSFGATHDVIRAGSFRGGGSRRWILLRAERLVNWTDGGVGEDDLYQPSLLPGSRSLDHMFA